MTEKEVLDIFIKHKALLKGHFRLSSGLHSETYLQCALVLQYPDIAEKLSGGLAKKFLKIRGNKGNIRGRIRGRIRERIGGEGIDVVIGLALGGITLAYEVARACGARALFTERADGRMVLRRGFSIKKGEKVLVVEDVVTTGGSTQEVVDIAAAAGGEIIGVGAIIDRSVKGLGFGAPFESLAKIHVETFEEKDCPFCEKGIPIVKPGSR